VDPVTQGDMAAAERVVVGVGKELSEEEKRMLESGHSFLEIDSRYSSFKIVRKEDGV
jgi:hypothetical protein